MVTPIEAVAAGTAGWVGQTTNAPATRTRGPVQGDSRTIPWLVAAGVIFLLAGGMGVVWMHGQSVAASRARETPLPEAPGAGVAVIPAAPVVPSTSAATVVPSDHVPAPDVDETSHALAGPAPVAAASTPQAHAPTRPPGAHIPPSLPTSPGKSPVPASSPSAAPASSPANCNPPYYLDAQGNRIFKKECVN